MPKRVIDFDALWGSDKLASCAAWAQAEYAWLYGLADASGCFELTNLRVIWGRVAAVRGNLTIERLEQVFVEFQEKGLLFAWEHEGKRYGHWTGSDVPGRLPAPSWRARLEHFAPPVPKQRLEEYLGKFARGRASLARAEFRGESANDGGARKEICRSGDAWPRSDRQGRGADVEGSQMVEERLLVASAGGGFRSEISNLRDGRGTSEPSETFTDPGNPSLGGRSGDSQNIESRRTCSGARQNLDGRRNDCSGGDCTKEKKFKGWVEEAQGQDLNLDLELDQKGKWGEERELEPGVESAAAGCAGDKTFAKNAPRNPVYDSRANSNSRPESNCNANSQSNANSNSSEHGNSISKRNQDSIPAANRGSIMQPHVNEESYAPARASGLQSLGTIAWNAKELALARELRVGEGPVCGPHGVRAEVLERIRKREEARAKKRSA